MFDSLLASFLLRAHTFYALYIMCMENIVSSDAEFIRCLFAAFMMNKMKEKAKTNGKNRITIYKKHAFFSISLCSHF